MRVCAFPARANVTKLTGVGVDVNGLKNARRAVQTKVFYREILIHLLVVLGAQLTQPARLLSRRAFHKKGLDPMMFAFSVEGVRHVPEDQTSRYGNKNHPVLIAVASNR